MATHVTLIGTVGSEPELIQFQSGVNKCAFRLAVTPRKRDSSSGQWRDGETDWYTVHAFRRLGMNVQESVSKGQRVIVSGRLRIRQWSTPDGKRGQTAEIDADGVGHDLRWGTTTFHKSLNPGHGAGVSQEDASRSNDPSPSAAEGTTDHEAQPWGEQSETPIAA